MNTILVQVNLLHAATSFLSVYKSEFANYGSFKEQNTSYHMISWLNFTFHHFFYLLFLYFLKTMWIVHRLFDNKLT